MIPTRRVRRQISMQLVMMHVVFIAIVAAAMVTTLPVSNFQ